MADQTTDEAKTKAAAEAQAAKDAIAKEIVEKKAKSDATAKREAELKRPDRYIVDGNIVDPDGNVIMPLSD